MLQKMESYTFIDCIAMELVKNSIVPLTIHDCIIVKVEQKERTIKIVEEIFIKYFEIIPAFKTELLRN